MIKTIIRAAVFACLIGCVTGCASTHRIDVDHTQERLQTTVQDSCGRRTVQETRRKSTKVIAEAEFQKKLAGK